MSDINKLLIISSVWPEPNSSAAGRRMMQLIRLFQSAGWQITYASTAEKSAHAVDLSSVDINTVSVQINSRTFDDFIASLQPQAVMFDRFMVEEQFGWRVAGQCPDALRILDTEDLHCLRRARQKAVKEGRGFAQADLLKETDAKREIASILRCDLSLIISAYEMKLLKNVFKIDQALIYYLPFMLDPLDDSIIKTWPGFKERTHFVTIGNFRHVPNMDAVQYLSKKIWPLIREQLPNAQMHIYGAYPSQKAKSYHQPDKIFYVKGRVKDADEVMKQARVCLAPLRFGAGLKGKLVQAMQCGTPSITTGIGAEGIAGSLEWSGSVADTPEAFASVAVRLYTDQPEWQAAQKRGIRIINQRFGKDLHGPAFIETINHLRDDLEQHRRNNFTGAMLMHHTATSTKYMARWIEEKNKQR